MREIKFRVWGVDTNGEGEKEMYYVNDVRDTDYSRRKFSNLENEDINELNPWMQYTGLKDKNGKEIYERDVLSHHEPFETHGIVEFSNGRFGFRFSKESGVESLLEYVNEGYEVIGNIYENPELLKENK